MKNTMRKIILGALLCCLLICSLASCTFSITSHRTTSVEGIWANATYQENTTFGTGEKTIYVTVQVEEHSVIFTIKTDKSTLGEAMMEHNLLEGESDMYGLYVKSVNGMIADYDTDQSWWGLYSHGEMLMTGVDTTEIADGDVFEMVRNVGY